MYDLIMQEGLVEVTEGYLPNSYDYEATKAIFNNQYSNGGVYITIGFTNREAYSKFLAEMGSNIWPVLQEMGIRENYLEYWEDYEHLTWSFVLSPLTIS